MSEKVQPTPGPWEVSEKSPFLVVGHDPRLFPDNERVTIARSDPNGDKLDVEIGIANAKLIAAAPRLLFLLDRMVNLSYEHERGHNSAICSCSSIRTEVRKVIKELGEVQFLG